MAYITIISSKKCEHCRRIKEMVTEAARIAKEPLHLIDVSSDTQAAINIALMFDFDTVPSLVINGVGFNGHNYSLEDLVRAMPLRRRSNG